MRGGGEVDLGNFGGVEWAKLRGEAFSFGILVGCDSLAFFF